MRKTTACLIFVVVLMVLVTFTPQGNEASKRKLRKIKKAVALALLL